MNENIFFPLVAYLIGGIPFGLILAKKFANLNIKNFGSKSIGATNVLRVLKEQCPKVAKKVAIATLLCDCLKGVIVILIAKIYGVSMNTQWSIAVFAVLGHCFSPYLKFEGGKGVATSTGVLACFIPFSVLVGFIGWFFGAKFIKISSIASFLGLICAVISSFIIYPNLSINTHAPILIIAFIIVYKHIPNIKRLILKEEKRVI